MMMTYDKVQGYIDLSFKIFQCLNGEVNKVNNNIKFVISPYDSSSISGRMKNYMVLELYIYKIISDSYDSDTIIKNTILFTIIHELFHADQRMYLSEYEDNDDYVEMVEAQVNFMTSIYIMNNRVILEKLFGFKILLHNIKVFLRELECDNNGIFYKRITIFDYYYELLKYLFSNNIRLLSNYLYYERDIEFHCEDNRSIIKKNNLFNTDTNDFSKIIYDNYLKIDRKTHRVGVNKIDGIVIIKSHIKGYLKDAIEFL